MVDLMAVRQVKVGLLFGKRPHVSPSLVRLRFQPIDHPVLLPSRYQSLVMDT